MTKGGELDRHVCPVWAGYLLASPVRRIWQNPRKILGPHIKPGMLVADVGCAMGFFSLDMARLVGPEGRVVCVDLQARMFRALEKRAKKAGLLDRIDRRVCSSDDLGLDDLAGKVDFAVAFDVVHEVSDPGAFLAQVFSLLKPGGRFLLVEPRGHVAVEYYEETLETAFEAGFEMIEPLKIPQSRAVLLGR